MGPSVVKTRPLEAKRPNHGNCLANYTFIIYEWKPSRGDDRPVLSFDVSKSAFRVRAVSSLGRPRHRDLSCLLGAARQIGTKQGLESIVYHKYMFLSGTARYTRCQRSANSLDRSRAFGLFLHRTPSPGWQNRSFAEKGTSFT